MNNVAQRRRFLKLAGFLTVSTAGTLLAGCHGSSDDDSGLPDPVPNPGDNTGTEPQPAGTWTFPMGIASGDPRPDSVVLWTKIEPVGNTLVGRDLQLAVQLSEVPFDSAEFKPEDILVSVEITAHERYFHTVRHRVEGLQSDKHYWYRFVIDNDISAQGRTKTAPAENAERQLNFAYLSCQDWNANHWAAYDLLSRDNYDNLDFIVHLGDYIYETAADSTFQQGGAEPAHMARPIEASRLSGEAPDGTRYARTLEDYRYLYGTYRSDPRIQAVHAKFPMIAIWDDHEFTDDAWQDHETYSNSNEVQGDRRRAANQAWFEFMPVTANDVSFAPDNNAYDNISIYREFAFGRMMHLVMTDERLFRQDHAIPEDEGDTALLAYLSRILRELSDLEDPNGLYQFVHNTSILFFKLENILNDAINKGTLPLGLSIDGMDLKLLKPMLLLILNKISPTPIPEDQPLNIDQVLTLLGTADPQMLVSMVGIDGLGSRYAALGEVLRKFLDRNAESKYAMLGRKQTEWWEQRMLSAQERGAVWKVWGNEVSFLKMNLDVNRVRNQGLQLSGMMGSLLGGVITGLISVLKYVLTNPEIRTTLDASAFNSDGSTATIAGQKLAVFADSWDGYPDARDHMSQFLAQRKIPNVIAITGDLHTFLAGQVVDSASNEPVLLDFAGAGVSSNSFGGLAASKLGGLADMSMLSGLKPLLTGRGTPSGMLANLVTEIISRADKENGGRDLLSRLILHFSDEVQWAEGIANGFVTVNMDMKKTRLTFHNLRVERDENGAILDPAYFASAGNLDEYYERRCSFTVYAQGSTPEDAATAAVWPAFPPKVMEYENPAVNETTETALAGPSVMMMKATATHQPDGTEIKALRDGVQGYVQTNPNNPFAKIFLESIQ